MELYISFSFSAISKGTQMLELDCHMTRDGEVVVSHDGHLVNKCVKDVHIAEVDLVVILTDGFQDT